MRSVVATGRRMNGSETPPLMADCSKPAKRTSPRLRNASSAAAWRPPSPRGEAAPGHRRRPDRQP